jgi:hypothetical protein
MTPRALPSKREERRGVVATLREGAAIVGGVLDAVDLAAAAVLAVAVLAVLWLDQWQASPFIAVLALLVLLRAVMRRVRSGPKSDECEDDVVH